MRSNFDFFYTIKILCVSFIVIVLLVVCIIVNRTKLNILNVNYSRRLHLYPLYTKQKERLILYYIIQRFHLKKKKNAQNTRSTDIEVVPISILFHDNVLLKGYSRTDVMQLLYPNDT